MTIKTTLKIIPSAVINWFKNLTPKENRRFLTFGKIFPKDLLSRAISYARTIINIEDKLIDVINLARKSVLFSKEGTWVKRGENPSFDVTMEALIGPRFVK